MRKITIACVLGLSIALTRDAAASETPSPKVTLVWADPQGLLRFGFDLMTDEVRAIFENAGVEVVWKTRVADVDTGWFIVVQLVPSWSTDFGPRQHTMGVLVKSPQSDGRLVRILFGNILRTLNLKYEKPTIPTASETANLARAIGRVVAHEVVHAFVPDAPHTETGLMQWRLTRVHLRDMRELRLSVTSKAALLARLARFGEPLPLRN